MFKKVYETPKMDVMEYRIDMSLLAASDGLDGVMEYNDEFGSIYNPEMDKKA